MSRKVRKKTLTLAERVQVIRRLESQESQTSIASSLGVNQSAVSRILKNREEILREWRLDANPDRKRKRFGRAKDVEDALLVWFGQVAERGAPLSGPALIEKADRLSADMGVEDFRPTLGWLERWKKRHNIAFKKQQQQRQQHGQGQDGGEFVVERRAKHGGVALEVAAVDDEADDERKENDASSEAPVHFADVIKSLEVVRRFMEQNGCESFQAFHELKETLFQVNQQAAVVKAVSRFHVNQ